MSILSWNDEGKKMFCARCIWRDEDPDVCHAIEPPRKDKPFTPNGPSDCYFFPEDRWNDRPKEYQERMMKEREERSERFWSKRGGKN